jgi:hypothetical protein
MKYSLLPLIFILSFNGMYVYANEDTHAHANKDVHIHKEMSDGSTIRIDQARLNSFSDGLEGAKILVVSVKGMVCDFCARGIEKTFKRDSDLLKIDVDLDFGKVLIAYKATAKVDENSIATKIRDNGQEVVKIDTLQ